QIGGDAMKSMSFGCFAMLLGCLLQPAGAQNSTATPAPTAVSPTVAAPSVATAPTLSNLLAADNSTHNYHLAAEVGFGVYYPHWGGSAPGAMLGTSGSINLFNEQHAAVGVGWSQFNQSSTKTGAWSFSHRP